MLDQTSQLLNELNEKSLSLCGRLFVWTTRQGNRGCRRLHPAKNDCERRNFNVNNTRGTQRGYSSKPTHSIVERFLVFKR